MFPYLFKKKKVTKINKDLWKESFPFDELISDKDGSGKTSGENKENKVNQTNSSSSATKNDGTKQGENIPAGESSEEANVSKGGSKDEKAGGGETTKDDAEQNSGDKNEAEIETDGSNTKDLFKKWEAVSTSTKNLTKSWSSKRDLTTTDDDNLKSSGGNPSSGGNESKDNDGDDEKEMGEPSQIEGTSQEQNQKGLSIPNAIPELPLTSEEASAQSPPENDYKGDSSKSEQDDSKKQNSSDNAKKETDDATKETDDKSAEKTAEDKSSEKTTDDDRKSAISEKGSSRQLTKDLISKRNLGYTDESKAENTSKNSDNSVAEGASPAESIKPSNHSASEKTKPATNNSSSDNNTAGASEKAVSSTIVSPKRTSIKDMAKLFGTSSDKKKFEPFKPKPKSTFLNSSNNKKEATPSSSSSSTTTTNNNNKASTSDNKAPMSPETKPSTATAPETKPPFAKTTETKPAFTFTKTSTTKPAFTKSTIAKTSETKTSDKPGPTSIAPKASSNTAIVKEKPGSAKELSKMWATKKDYGNKTSPSNGGSTSAAETSESIVSGQGTRLDEECAQLLLDIRRIGKGPKVKYGELFDDPKVEQYYEALVGTLKSAKKRGLITFKGQMLLKGVHDKVEISIVNP